MAGFPAGYDDEPVIRFALPSQLDERERRVALTPAAVARLAERGHSIVVEGGAGERAGFADHDYRRAGAEVADLEETLGSDGLVAMVTGPRSEASDRQQRLVAALTPHHHVIGLQDPLWRPADAAKLAATGATFFALELLPRTTRAQSMDVLSSMATVAGYEAALLAATRVPKLLPLMMTAAGTVPAAKVLVLGAGVAGLQAIATARRLGAVVEGYDIRRAATEQIRSLGARAIEAVVTDEPAEDAGGYARRQDDTVSQAQHELLAPHVAEADAVITTAAIPGAASPELISPAMVAAMRAGAVIVDLAAERGGNCALSQPDVEVVSGGVTILAPTDLASRAPQTSSRLFAGNVMAFVEHLTGDDGTLALDRSDDIIAATLVSTKGEVVHPQVLARLEGPEVGEGPLP